VLLISLILSEKAVISIETRLTRSKRLLKVIGMETISGNLLIERRMVPLSTPSLLSVESMAQPQKRPPQLLLLITPLSASSGKSTNTITTLEFLASFMEDIQEITTLVVTLGNSSQLS
jgi:hypothetical protein